MKNRTIVLLAVGVGAMVGAPKVRAESSQGGAFQLPAYGARGWGMAGAFVVRVDDESAVDWNPAGLGRASRSAGVSYLQLVEGVSMGQSQLVFAMPLGQGRHETGVARHAAGVMLTNLSADVLGGETYSENHLRLAYAFTPEPLVSFALAASAFVSQSGIPGFDAWGTSFDASGLLSLSRAWSIALVARDPFSRYSYDDGRDYEKEPQYIVGVAWQGESHFGAEIDVVRSYGDWTRLSFGAETGYFFSHVALRAGVAFLPADETRTVPSFGVSARAFAARLSLHYGATLDEEDAFGRTHRVSLAVTL